MKRKILSMALAVLLLTGSMVGCSDANNSTVINEATAASNSAVINEAAAASDIADIINTGTVSLTSVSVVTEKLKDEDTDSSWDAPTSTQITLTGSTATVSGSGAAVSGGTVTITKAGTYVVSGTLSKGQILVNAAKDDLVRLVLNGADITADTNAAIYAAQADKLVIILADGSTNTVADTASYTYADTDKEEPNAAIFSKCDLSINGTGTLDVTGNFNHGIATKDDLVIAGGNITATAVNVAMRGKDSVTVLDSVLNLTSLTGDGLKSTNDTDDNKGWILIKGGELNITAYNDGIQAQTTLQIDGGTFNITTGGGWPGGSLKRGSHARNNDGVVSGSNPTDGSYKGIKSDGEIVINNGTFTISSYDDSVHSNGDIIINGGSLTAQSGDDGIHADGIVTINNGTIDIKNSYEGIEGAFINLNGGKISVYATDDGINVNSSSGLLTISGGDIYVNADGDGIDSNSSAVMTGGTLYVDGPTSASDEAIDTEKGFSMNGGTLVAASAVAAGNVSTSSAQPAIKLSVQSQAAGATITVKSSSGTVLVSYTPQKSYSSVLVSSPDIKTGESYSVYVNDTLAGTATATIGTSGGMGGNQGGPGGMGGQGGRQGAPSGQAAPGSQGGAGQAAPGGQGERKGRP